MSPVTHVFAQAISRTGPSVESQHVSGYRLEKPALVVVADRRRSKTQPAGHRV
jgi:hypothetical protein